MQKFKSILITTMIVLIFNPISLSGAILGIGLCVFSYLPVGPQTTSVSAATPMYVPGPLMGGQIPTRRINPVWEEEQRKAKAAADKAYEAYQTAQIARQAKQRPPLGQRPDPLGINPVLGSQPLGR